MAKEMNKRKWNIRVAFAACIALFTVLGTMAFIYFNHQSHAGSLAETQVQNLAILEQAKSILGVVILGF